MINVHYDFVLTETESQAVRRLMSEYLKKRKELGNTGEEFYRKDWLAENLKWIEKTIDKILSGVGEVDENENVRWNLFLDAFQAQELGSIIQSGIVDSYSKICTTFTLGLSEADECSLNNSMNEYIIFLKGILKKVNDGEQECD